MFYASSLQDSTDNTLYKHVTDFVKADNEF